MHTILHGRSRSPSDKVKVVRYCWQDTAVQWPNKLQDLLDWLSATLSPPGRKRLTISELQNVWRCLQDVLATKKCHRPTASGQLLLLKPVVLQLLLTELGNHASGKSTTCHSQTVVVSCCHSILTSSAFSHTWSARLDSILQLFLGSVQLCCQLLRSSEVSVDLVELMKASSQRYTALYQQSANPQQVFQQASQKLFHPVATLLQLLSTYRGDLMDRLTNTVEDMVTATLRALTQKELQTHYELYLTLKVTTSEIDSSPPKFLETFFTQLSKDFEGGSTCQASVLAVLPRLYQVFVQNYRNNAMCFQFLQHLLELLQVIQTKDPDVLKPCTNTIQEKLRTVTVLLDVVVREDVYNLTEDHLHGNKQLSWLRCLGDWVSKLPESDRNSDWYTTQKHLLSLNHSIVEPNIVSLLQLSWLHVGQMEASALDHQTTLLCELVGLYTQLRQLPKFISKLMLAMKEKPLPQAIRWAPQLQDRLAESVTSQPPSVVMEIWELILKEIATHYAQDSDASHGLDVVSRVLCLLLTRARLIDYTVTDQMALKAMQLMSQTRDTVLKPYIKGLNKMPLPPYTAAILELAHSWGQLDQLLSNYSSQYLSTASASDNPVDPGDPDRTISDLTAVHGYVSYKVWAAVCSKIKSCGEPHVCFVWVKLLMQKLRSLLCREPVDAASVQTSIGGVMNQLFVYIPEGSSLCQQSDSSQGLTVSEETLPVAVWQELCKVLPLVHNHLNTTHRHWIAGHFVKCLTQCADEDSAKKNNFHAFSPSGALWEMSDLMSDILKNILSSTKNHLSCVENLDKGRSPKKKKRKSYGTPGLISVFEQLLKTNTDDGECLKALCEEMKDRLLSAPETLKLSSKTMQNVLCTFKSLKQLPLEFLSTGNQTLCLLATLSLVSTLPLTDNTFSLVEACVDVLYVLHCSIDAKSMLTEHLNFAYTLQWIHDLMSQTQNLPQLLIDKFEQLYTAVLKKATWNATQLDLVKQHVKQCVACACSKDSSAVSNRLLLNILHHTVKVLSRPYVPEAIRGGMRKLHAILHKWVLHLMGAHLTMTASHTAGAASTANPRQGVAVQAFSYDLRYLVEMGADDADPLLERVITVSEICVDQLSESQSTDQLSSWLLFVSTVCQCHMTSVPNDPTNQTDSQCTEGVSDDTMETEDTNKKPENVKPPKKLPCLDAFYEKCWPCLLNVLYTTHAEHGTKLLTESLRKELEQALSHLVSVASPAQYGKWLHALLHNMSPECGLDKPERAVVSLDVWRLLLTISVTNVQRDLLQACQKLILELQQLLTEISQSWHPRYSPLVVTALTTQTTLLSWGQGRLSAQYISAVLHSCDVAPLLDVPLDVFCTHYLAVTTVLRDMLAYHTTTVCARIPAYCLCVRRLLVAIVWCGRQKEEGSTETEVDKLVQCAQQTDRLLGLMSLNKKDFAKVAVYIVADYTNDVQKVTLIPRVKKALLPGVYQCLGLCDEHAIALLHTTLPPGVKDVFRTLYAEYKKYYKYTGRI